MNNLKDISAIRLKSLGFVVLLYFILKWCLYYFFINTRFR